MKLVSYIRVSAGVQRDHGNGLDVQKRAIRRWAKDAGHRIVRWCEDAGVSGAKPADERPGLAEALATLRDGAAVGLVVYQLDRLARSITVQEAVLATVWERPERLMFTVQGVVMRDDPDDPMRTAMREMMGVFAGLERRMLVKRMRDGRSAKAARGGHAVGAYPFGCDRDGVVASEQDTLRRILAMHADGASTREIAAVLNAEGRPTKRGSTWTSPVVSTVLRRHVTGKAVA